MNFYTDQVRYEAAIKIAGEGYPSLSWESPILQSIIYRTYGMLEKSPKTKQGDGGARVPFLQRQEICKSFVLSYMNPMIAPIAYYKIPVTVENVREVFDGSIKDFDIYKVDYEVEDVLHWLVFIGSPSEDDVQHIEESVSLGDMAMLDDSFHGCDEPCPTCKEAEKAEIATG